MGSSNLGLTEKGGNGFYLPSDGALVYRLGHGPLKAERRVQFPCALPPLPSISSFQVGFSDGYPAEILSVSGGSSSGKPFAVFVGAWFSPVLGFPVPTPPKKTVKQTTQRCFGRSRRSQRPKPERCNRIVPHGLSYPSQYRPKAFLGIDRSPSGLASQELALLKKSPCLGSCPDNTKPRMQLHRSDSVERFSWEERGGVADPFAR